MINEIRPVVERHLVAVNITHEVMTNLCLYELYLTKMCENHEYFKGKDNWYVQNLVLVGVGSKERNFIASAYLNGRVSINFL